MLRLFCTLLLDSLLFWQVFTKKDYHGWLGTKLSMWRKKFWNIISQTTVTNKGTLLLCPWIQAGPSRLLCFLLSRVGLQQCERQESNCCRQMNRGRDFSSLREATHKRLLESHLQIIGFQFSFREVLRAMGHDKEKFAVSTFYEEKIVLAVNTLSEIALYQLM